MPASRSLRVVAVVVAAAVSLTCGESAGPDPNAVARVVISPHSGSIDTGDSLQLVAVARNAAGDELSGKSIAWSTLDQTLVTVGGNGRVHGRWPGSARVVAASDGKADTAVVSIVAKITTLSFTPALDTLTALGASVNVTVHASIGGQSYSGGTYTWELTDTSVARLFAGGLDTVRAVQASKNGTTFLRVREARGAVDSARIVVRQRPKLIILATLLRAYRACPYRVTVFVADSLGHPVPDTVRWSSTDTTLARIDSTGLLTPLAPGLDTIVVQAGPVSRRVPLTVSVAPAVTLQISGVASRVTTVGRGQFAAGFGSLGGGSSEAPARFSVVSSDTTILGVVPPDTSLPLGGQPEFGPLRLVGRSLGAVTLTPYLCDVPGSSVPFTVTPSVMTVYGDLLTTARIDDPPASLAVLTRDTTGAVQATVSQVTLRITSSDTAVVRPDSTYYHVPAGSFRADFRFTFPDSGSARLVVHDSAGLYPPDSTAMIHVGYPPIYFGDNLNFVGGDTLRVAMRQRIYRPLQPGQFGQRSLVLLDRDVVGAPISIQLSNSDSTVARLSPDAVTIPIGGSTAPIDIVGGDVRGYATLTARALRHIDGHLVVKTDRPRLGFYNFGSGQYPGDSMRVEVAAFDSATMMRGYPTEDLTFTLSVNDTSVVSLHSTTLTYHAGAETSSVAFAVFKRPGTASVTVTDPRPAAYAYPPETTPEVTVLAPYLATEESDISLGIRQNRDIIVIVNGPNQDSLIVHVRQTNAAVLSLPDTIITIPAFPNTGSVVATGAASGVDTVVVSAAGFRPDTMVITVGIPTAVMPQWPTNVTVGDSVPLLLETAAPDGTGRTTADTVVFTLAPNANIEFHLDGAVISTLTVPAGSYYAPFFWVKAKAAGTGTVTVTAPNYTPLIQSVTISP